VKATPRFKALILRHKLLSLETQVASTAPRSTDLQHATPTQDWPAPAAFAGIEVGIGDLQSHGKQMERWADCAVPCFGKDL
jgi:hypothetical protein